MDKQLLKEIILEQGEKIKEKKNEKWVEREELDQIKKYGSSPKCVGELIYKIRD
ncbi:MAG: hypothetical protein V1910_01850 [bacterium]